MGQLLSFSSVMSYIFYIVVAIVVLLLMITIHELGHYTAGKLLGFKINEFSVGFGKALYKKVNKKTGEIFSLRLFPLGGYCAFAGESEDGKSKDDFNSQKPWKRLIVFFMGAFFNFLSAIIFSFILLVSYGYEQVQITDVVETSPNYAILQAGDIIYEVDGKKLDFVNDEMFSLIIQNFEENEEFSMKVKRSGEYVLVENVKKVNIGTEEAPVLSMGIYLKTYNYSFLEALAYCVPFTLKWCWKILLILGMLFTGKLALTSIGGPITTITTMATYTQTNFANFVLLLPLIATNLAVFNLLPFPALDGSKMVFTTIEWIFRKPINRKVEAMINNIGLIVLLVFVVFVDILHFLT